MDTIQDHSPLRISRYFRDRKIKDFNLDQLFRIQLRNPCILKNKTIPMFPVREAAFGCSTAWTVARVPAVIVQCWIFQHSLSVQGTRHLQDELLVVEKKDELYGLAPPLPFHCRSVWNASKCCTSHKAFAFLKKSHLPVHCRKVWGLHQGGLLPVV